MKNTRMRWQNRKRSSNQHGTLGKRIWITKISSVIKLKAIRRFFSRKKPNNNGNNNND